MGSVVGLAVPLVPRVPVVPVAPGVLVGPGVAVGPGVVAGPGAVVAPGVPGVLVGSGVPVAPVVPVVPGVPVVPAPPCACAMASGATSTLAASNSAGIAFLVFIVISLRTGKPNCRRIRTASTRLVTNTDNCGIRHPWRRFSM
ncbi:hypothetical protein D3C72_2068830 [compost metagenome]